MNDVEERRQCGVAHLVPVIIMCYMLLTTTTAAATGGYN